MYTKGIVRDVEELEYVNMVYNEHVVFHVKDLVYANIKPRDICVQNVKARDVVCTETTNVSVKCAKVLVCVFTLNIVTNV